MGKRGILDMHTFQGGMHFTDQTAASSLTGGGISATFSKRTP